MRAATNFYFSQFMFGFCRHVPLVGAMLVVVGLIFVPDFNRAFGIDHLLWHENGLKQGGVGFALGVVVVQTLLAGYLLETIFSRPKQRPCYHRFGPALTYGLGVLACVAVTVAPLLPAVESSWSNVIHGLPLAAGMLVAGLIALVGLRLLHREEGKESWVATLGEWQFQALSHVRLLHVPRAAAEDMPVHGVAVLAQVFAFVIYVALGFEVFGFYSPFVGVFALLGILVAIYGFLQYFLARVQPLLVLLLLGFIYLGGMSRYQLRFPALERVYADPVLLETYNPTGRADLLLPESIDFCGTSRGPYPAGAKRPLVIVCVSGGGIRAAAWTTAMLHHLEHRFAQKGIDFPCHVRVITGASGGMVGAGYYVANLPNPPPSPLARDISTLDDQYNAVTTDCLSPLIHAMTYQDVRSTFSPFGRPRDRGQALEAAWSTNMKGALDQSFDRMMAGEKAGWRPSLIFSPMLVEDGRRLLISNLDLNGVASNDGSIIQDYRDNQPDMALPLRANLNRFSYESYEFFRLFPAPEIRQALKLATAARMSASFAYVSPAVTLPTSPRRRVVDAGYYDNDGVSLAASWVFSGGNRDWIRKHASKIVLIQIRDGVSERSRKLTSKPVESSTALTRGMEFLTTPAIGLFNARIGSSSFRNDGLLEILSQQMINELQVRPLLNELSEEEIKVLRVAKERDVIKAFQAIVGDTSPRGQQVKAAMRRKKESAADNVKDRIDKLDAKMQEMTMSEQEKLKWRDRLVAYKPDEKPEQLVDRLIRDVELQAASIELTPEDEKKLMESLTVRLKSVPRAAALVARVQRTFDSTAGRPFFTTVACEYGGEASLSWYLTDQEKEEILSETMKLDPRIDLLLDWWLTPSAQDGPAGQ